MSDDRPIGFFDSGIGGISLLRYALALLPKENYIYYGDNKNAPYGNKSEDEILALTAAAADYLLSRGVKALVLACNTATSAAAEHLRATLPLPIIGVEPALKPAYENRGDGQIIVMATSATLRQKKFRALMEKYGGDAIGVPGSGLVELIEGGVLAGDELNTLLHQILDKPLGTKTDSIVLGCTHYPFIKEAISAVAGSDVAILDGTEGTIRRLKSVLRENGLLCGQSGDGKVELITSSGSKKTLELMKNLLYT